VHQFISSDSEAKNAAETHFRQSARKFVSGSGIALGNGLLRAGCIVNIAGIGKLYEGRYFVTKVRHLFNTHEGYRTMFKVERAGIGS
jgi:uncharacterized protein